MSNPSNLYAEKVFSEHPTSLWALDDAADYASLISSLSLQKDLTEWTYGTVPLIVSESPLDLNDPFPNEKKYSIQPESVGEFKLILQSDTIIPRSVLNTTKETMTIGMYVYIDSLYISSVGLGHFVDPEEEYVQTFSNLPFNEWVFISKTVPVPTTGTDIKFRITINAEEGETFPSESLMYINGINFGQWNEEFHVTSMGQDSLSIVDTIYGLNGNGVAISGIKAESYGLQNSPGYYIVEDSLLLCKNSGIPLVYGSSNVSMLYPSSVTGSPSLIIPGKGFMNRSGQYQTFTAEMWLRINAHTYEERRIFGPIGHYDDGSGDLYPSTDGLYVSGPFLKLKIGNTVGSHYVSEWNRPMLINIRMSNNSAALMINGDQVFSMNFDSSQLNFPEAVVKDGEDVYENDWLGFFAYEDIPTLEVDCIAIYSYLVPAVMAKRRWVYGQAVEFPNDINTAYNGSSYLIDHSVSGSTNNYNYPELASWKQGNVIENLSLANNYLSAPNYALAPIVFSSNYTTQELLESFDLGFGQTEVFYLNTDPDDPEKPNSYMYFNKLGFLTDQTKAFYGVFSSNYVEEEQVLFHLEDGSTGNYFEISLGFEDDEPTGIVYTLKYNGELSTILTTPVPDNTSPFGVGLDIETFANFFGGNVKTFFGKSQTLVLYVGNRKDFSKQYSGAIHRIGFCTPRNLEKISDEFNEQGIVQDTIVDAGNIVEDTIDSEITGGSPATVIWSGGTYDAGYPETHLLVHTATYTILTTYDLGVFKLDIATDSYWEDSVPLSYFAKYVENETGGTDYKLDTLQFNVSYPEMELLDGIYYDTTESQVKTYITFQNLLTGANANASKFIYNKRLRGSNVLIPDSKWEITKYEIVDNSIVYLPQGVDFNKLAIVVHVEMINNGILSNPIRIKSVQISPKSLSQTTSNPINTKLGVEIYPYAKSGLYYDYAGRAPFTIYKGSTPYLYLTRNTGIELKDTEDGQQTGLSFPINRDQSPKYSISAIQLAMRVNRESFATLGISGTPVEPLFELETKDYTINFYTKSIDPSGKRAIIYAIDTRTGAIADGVLYYINGKLVKDAVVNVDEWNILAVSFTRPPSLNSYSGSFRVVGKNVLVNNLSHYQLTSAQEVFATEQRQWLEVKEPEGSVVAWSYWPADGDGTWQNVLNLVDVILSTVDPSEFYKAYTGTNKKIIEDDQQLTFGNYQYSFYTDVSWQSNTITPV